MRCVAAGEHVVPRQRGGGLVAGELELPDHVVEVAERVFAAGEVEFEEAAEAFVVEGGDGVAVGVEAAAPVADGFGVVEAEDFDVRGDEFLVFDGAEDFGEGGGVAAGEDVAGDPGVGDGGAVAAADGVDERDAVRREEIAEGSEVFGIVGDADMFEHADGDDAVERAGDGAVILKREGDAVGEAGGVRAGAGGFELLGGQRDAGDAGAVILGQRDGHAAPAGADVQYVEIGLGEAEFGGDVAFLFGLGFFERFVAAGEVGARVVPVAVQEEGIEAAVEIVMMGDIAARAGNWVVLGSFAECAGDGAAQRKAGVGAAVGEVGEEEIQNVFEFAVERDEVSGDVGFAEDEGRVAEEAADCAPGGDGGASDGCGAAGFGWGAVGLDLAVWEPDGEAAGGDEVLQDGVDQGAHRGVAPWW